MKRPVGAIIVRNRRIIATGQGVVDASGLNKLMMRDQIFHLITGIVVLHATLLIAMKAGAFAAMGEGISSVAMSVFAYTRRRMRF